MNTRPYLLLAILLGCFSQVIAEPIIAHHADRIDLLSHTPPSVYQGQMVVRAQTSTQQQLDTLLQLVESVWSESTAVGPIDIQIKQSKLPAITALDIPHQVLIQDLQTYTTANWNQMVDIHRQNQDRPPLGAAVHDDLWFDNYKQLHEITDYINNIVALRPDLASTQVIGQSWEGRDMFSITISAPDSLENSRADRPVVFLFSTVHAREWIAPMTTTYFASKLIEDYDTDPRVQAILDSTRVIIVPIGNPDGYLYTWSDYRYWRKNRRDIENSTRFGVDINRNWGYEWGGPGSSGSPSSDTYRGTVPFSEPETATLRDTALNLGDKLVAHLEYHSYSQLVMYPWGYSSTPPPEPDLTYFEFLTNELADEIYSVHEESYVPQQSSDLYRHAGNSPDWFYGELGIPSLLIELRPRNSDFDPHPSNILPCAQENYQAIKTYLERAVEPFSFYPARFPYWSSRTPSIEPDTPTQIFTAIIDRLEVVDFSTAKLFTRIGNTGPFNPTSNLTYAGNNYYYGTTPAVPCGQTLEYYFQATTITGQIHTYPPSGPSTPLRVPAMQLVTSRFEDAETDSGWIVGDPSDTATAGIWERADPSQVIAQDGSITQPENDTTPYGTHCWVTDGTAGIDGNAHDVDNGTTTLISPRFDATLGSDPQVTFWYWIYSDFHNNGYMSMSISNDDGITWTDLGIFTGTGQVWREFIFPVDFYIDFSFEPTDHMRIKFLAVDDAPDGITEVTIDDFRVEFLGCPSPNPADFNNDRQLDYDDVVAFLNAYNAGNPTSDFNQDANFNYLDISAFLTAFSAGMP